MVINKQLYNCQCGSSFQFINKKRHEKSKRHIYYECKHKFTNLLPYDVQKYILKFVEFPRPMYLDELDNKIESFNSGKYDHLLMDIIGRYNDYDKNFYHWYFNELDVSRLFILNF